MNTSQKMDQNEQETVILSDDTETTEETETEEVDVEALKRENATLKAQKDHWKEKATKPKEEKKEEKKEETAVGAPQGLSQKDLLAVIEAKVPSEDLDDVVEYANLKKISVTEALKTSVVKTILAEKAEFRKTAQATNAGNGKRVVTKVDDTALMKDLSQGKVPEKGSEEAERLFWARRGGKR